MLDHIHPVAWARFYLVKAGLLYSPKRTIRALTDAGRCAEMTDELAVDIIRREHSALKADEDEDRAPEREIAPDGKNFMFVGATWDKSDQTSRFAGEGIWQNGYDDNFSYLERQMKPGDRIAIRATYSRNYDQS